MPIKRIQLGGISRTPSDRMSRSGSVAESVNVTLNGAGELAPVVPPVDLAQSLGLPTIEVEKGQIGMITDTWRAVYIHKVQGVSHYIYCRKNFTTGTETLVAFAPEKIEIATTSASETFVDETITAVGNALCYSTTNGKGYALWSNGTYKYLGSDIPRLALNVKPNLYSDDAVCDVYKKNVGLAAKQYTAAEVNAQIKLDETERDEWFTKLFDAEKLWDVQGDFLRSQYFRYPVFVRFALKLYDNSYIHHTVPVYVSGGDLRYDMQLTYVTAPTTGGSSGYYTWSHVKQSGLAYKIKVTLAEIKETYQGWKDMIQSIDMFISAPIIYPLFNSELKYCEQGTKTDASGSVVSDETWMRLHFDTIIGTDEEKAAKNSLLLDKSRLFYKVRSFKVDELSELEAGVEIDNTEELSYTENLYTRESLEDDFRTNHTYVPEKNYVINRRLLSLGVDEYFSRGMSNLYGLKPTDKLSISSYSPVVYKCLYEITDNDGTKKYVESQGNLQTQKLASYPVKKGEYPGIASWTYYGSDAAQLLFYPDSRCSAVYVIRAEDGKAVKLTMTGHPYLNCAYYLGDIDKTLADLTFVTMDLPDENRKGASYSEQYVFQSAVENPFCYPVTGRVRLSANVLAVASITTALSEGQYGQYDLYAFTSEGVFTLKGNTEGDFSSIYPLSRDVCLSASAVVSVDQGVVFVTAKGVMLLTGSQIMNLSADMAGKPYVMEDKVTEMVNGALDVGFTSVLQSGKTLIDFMKTDGTQVGYDYTGARLLFINKSYRYFYTYLFGTKSWHKYVLPSLESSSALASGLSKAKVLNGYPECLLFAGIGNSFSRDLYLYDMSTRLDELDETTEIKGVIATRAFSLEEPDIHKTIMHLKIRGQYVEKDSEGKARVSYILLGSQDGRTFTRLTSLRGKSWKYYRIVMMVKLKSTERISWIDIDYESRFNNKLR